LRIPKLTKFDVAIWIALFVVVVWRLTLLQETPPVIHRVQARETLARIAREQDTRVKDIMAANPGLDPRRLKVGQEIVIPNKPFLARVGHQLDRMSAWFGFDDPPFERTAYRITAAGSD